MARFDREPEGKTVYPAVSYFPTASIYPAIPTTLRFHSTLLVPTPQGKKATYIWTQIPLSFQPFVPRTGSHSSLQTSSWEKLAPREVCLQGLTWQLTACRFGGLPKLDLVHCLYWHCLPTILFSSTMFSFEKNNCT